MHLSLTFQPLVSLISGLLILIMPKLLNYIVALYLIISGVHGLFGISALTPPSTETSVTVTN